MPINAVIMPAIPFVLPFPGVPMMSASASAALNTDGGVVGGISLNPDGTLSAGLDASLGPFALSLNASLPPLFTTDEPGGIFLGPTWGIYDESGEAIAPWDSVVRVDYRKDNRIADFPIEDGAFASYNKVETPYDVRISFVVGSGGGASQRTALLAALEAAVASLDFYTVVTPEALYYRANLTHLDYSRESRRGVNLLVVDVWVREVRPADTAQFADDGTQDPKSPTAKGAGNSGQTQAVPVSLADAEQPTPGVPFTPSSDPDMPTLGSRAGPEIDPAAAPANMPTESAPTVPFVPAIPPTPAVPPGPLPPVPAVMPAGVLF